MAFKIGGLLFSKSQFKWWYGILVGLACIADGLVMVFTLGYIVTHIAMRVALYAAKKDIYRRRNSK